MPGGFSRNELELVQVAIKLGALTVGGKLSAKESELIRGAGLLASPPSLDVHRVEQMVIAGRDPLGNALAHLRRDGDGKRAGVVYTPMNVVRPMVAWTMSQEPARVVDAGCGSGRFAAAVAKQSPNTAVIAVDVDPVATLLCRAALAVLGAQHSTVRNESFLGMALAKIDGRTAFISNPPYVRHHLVGSDDKEWLELAAKAVGHSTAPTRAGLHAYFFFAAHLLGRRGDIGCFLTAAEWLDVQYGLAVRALLLDGLGASAVSLIHPETRTFRSVNSTAVVTCFELGSEPTSVPFRQVKRVSGLAPLGGGRRIDASELRSTSKWTAIFNSKPDRPLKRGYARIPLRRLVTARRGIATGANAFFVMEAAEAEAAGIATWCVPVISRATEILESDGRVRDTKERMHLLLLPASLRRLRFPALHRYLGIGEHGRNGDPRVKDRYLCQQRNPWYAVEWPAPAPIVVTYMARRPPKFALNPDQLGLLNIGHYIYPRRGDLDVAELVHELNKQRSHLMAGGRTYQGGLKKFEPNELLDLMVDVPKRLLLPEKSDRTQAPPAS